MLEWSAERTLALGKARRWSGDVVGAGRMRERRMKVGLCGAGGVLDEALEACPTSDEGWAGAGRGEPISRWLYTGAGCAGVSDETRSTDVAQWALDDGTRTKLDELWC